MAAVNVADSQLVASADWTPGQGGPGRLVVTLRSGGQKTYTFIVDNDVGQGFVDAPSKGAYFGIVLRKYPSVQS